MKASEPALQGGDYGGPVVDLSAAWYPVFQVVIFILMMVIDYITGMLASKVETIAYPDNLEYGWSSRKRILVTYEVIKTLS